MADSNTFKTTGGRPASGPLALSAAAVGLLTVIVAFAVSPFGAPAVVASWALLLVGTVLAIVPNRLRPVGKGLAFAGVALPAAAFVYVWVLVSVRVLVDPVVW